ncbi:MAG: SemiSWEET transporter [Bacteroidetes bacterium]|jgi:MtN3 and saliva related transmembrane protein|nr:SemiSWEET transporter [Bacteroidota bacterium]MDF1867955.1 SemiSWEET transporter [Saprospiraceae bacterium]
MNTIGIVAAILTTGAFLPQALKTIKTKQTDDLSLTTFSMIFIGTILWSFYGHFIEDNPLLFANVITAFLSGIIVTLKINSMLEAKK